jgi:hypothetical protein
VIFDPFFGIKSASGMIGDRVTFVHHLDGSLAEFLNPSLMPTERAVAEVEGWILGVM